MARRRARPTVSRATVGSGASQQTQTPGVQAGGYKLSLTEAQRKKLVDEGVLDLSEEQYTGGVRHQIESLRKRATTAEKKLGEITGGDRIGECLPVSSLVGFGCSPNRELTMRTHHRNPLEPLAGECDRVGQFGQFPRETREIGRRGATRATNRARCGFSGTCMRRLHGCSGFRADGHPLPSWPLSLNG